MPRYIEKDSMQCSLRAREISINENDTSDRLSKSDCRELNQLKKKSHKTEIEVRRKEKAFAEAAALLVIK